MKENDKDKQKKKGSDENFYNQNTQEFDLNYYLDKYAEPEVKKPKVNENKNMKSNSKNSGSKKPNPANMNSKNPNSKANTKNNIKNNSKTPNNMPKIPSNKDPKMEDISSYTAKAKIKEKLSVPGSHKKWSTGRKVSMAVLIVFVICLATFFGLFYQKLSLINTGGSGKEKFTGQDKIVNDIDYSDINGVTNAKDLFGMLKEWANNGGEKMSSGNVVNVLLLGVDSKSNLSDTMMLMSIDKKNKKLNLVSFYRDSLTYLKTPKGKETYAKMNASYSNGGADLVVKTLENNYKIKIDDYALVDYNSFPKVIDALGGVTVDVKSNEAKYMNTNYGFGMSSGVQKLNGVRALKYCRIRYCDADSDYSRTRRQRAVITSIMNSFKNASLSQMNKAINALFPNVETSMSKSNIVGYGTKAVSNGWLNFAMQPADMPSKDTRKGQRINPLGDVIIADYPGAAYQLQTLLYGKSNIKLSKNRVPAINLKPTTATSKYNETTYSNTTTKSGTTTDVASLLSISASSTSVSVNVGSSSSVTITGKYSDSTTKNLTSSCTWTTNNNSVATVSSSGTITAVAEGTATITATYSGQSVKINVTVNDVKTLKKLSASSAVVSVRIGNSSSVTITGTYSDATTATIANSSCTWSSENESTATVSNGTITGVSIGSTSVTATYGGQSVKITVIVTI